MAVDIDESSPEMLTITWGRTITDPDVHRVIERVEAYAARGARFVVLADTRVAATPNAKQRRLFTDAFARLSKLQPCPLAGCAVCISSPIIRGVLKAMEWVFPPPFPMKAFDGMAAALAWSRIQIGAHDTRSTTRRAG
jgi:hypothetical protein